MPIRDDLLDTYLATHPSHHEFHESWPVQGRMRVRLSLAETLPPAHVSSSILSIVLDANRKVLFLRPSKRSGNISHLLVGGRPEPGETPNDTAIREVGEETGWRVNPLGMIGFRHFCQLEPRSEDSDRPYPDFIQPIYAARAVAFEPGLLLPSHQIPAEFLDLSEAERSIEVEQHPLIHSAVDAHRKAEP